MYNNICFERSNMTDNKPDKILELLSELHQKTRSVQEIALDSNDLSLREYQIINVIYKNNEPICQNVLADELKVDKALITRYLSALEAKQYIKRVSNTDNKREKNVILCEQATALIPLLKSNHLKSTNQIFSSFSSDEMHLLENLLIKIIKNITF